MTHQMKVTSDLNKMPLITDEFARGKMSFNPSLSHEFDSKIKVDTNRVKRQFNEMKIERTISDADTLGSVFMARELEFLHANIMEVLYAENRYREAFPVKNLENAGYTSHTYRVIDKVGRAKPIGSNVNDLPRADVAGKDVRAPIVACGISYGVTMQELASASLVNMSLIEEKASSCKRAMEELFQKFSLEGDTAIALNGLLIDPNINKANVVGGVWSTKTPQEIYEDIANMITELAADSKDVHQVTNIVMPVSQYNTIQQTRMADGTDTTILEYVLRNNPINISKMPQLEGAGTGGLDVMIGYQKDNSVFEYVIGLELTFLEPQMQALELIVPAWSTTAGMSVKRPLGLIIKEGI
jgi:hypothetical protein